MTHPAAFATGAPLPYSMTCHSANSTIPSPESKARFEDKLIKKSHLVNQSIDLGLEEFPSGRTTVIVQQTSV
jgi:hypothetical protein